jgi:hypothetical protein
LREQGDTVAKTWEYRCFIENYEKLKHKVTGNTIGGNVMELPDHSLFVSMSNEYSQVFIVDTNKNILFSAMPETWERREKVWRMVDEYHASIVKDRAEMERMILNTAGGK